MQLKTAFKRIVKDYQKTAVSRINNCSLQSKCEQSRWYNTESTARSVSKHKSETWLARNSIDRYSP